MRLNIKEIEDVNDFETTFNFTEGLCPVPLFHGTREYALTVSDEDRKRFYDACAKVIVFAKKVAFGDVVDDNTLFEYQRTKNNKFLGTVVYTYNTALYEYSSFYVTTSYTNALIFSNCSGGELGDWAYHQCVGFEDFNIELDKEIKEAVKVVKEEYQKYNSSEKIVLVYSDVKEENLFTQSGEPTVIENENGKFNYFDADFPKKCVDSDRMKSQHTFRLADPNAYCATLIREKAIRDGFFVFTEISDVDKYLERKNWSFE